MPSSSSTTTNGKSERQPRTKKSSRRLTSRRSSLSSQQQQQQWDRPYIGAFIILISLYLGVTLLAYDKLTRTLGNHGDSNGNQDNADLSRSGNTLSNKDHPLQMGRASSSSLHDTTKTIDYLQHHAFPLHTNTQHQSGNNNAKNNNLGDMEWMDHPGLTLTPHQDKIPQGLPRQILVPQFWSEAYAEYYNRDNNHPTSQTTEENDLGNIENNNNNDNYDPNNLSSVRQFLGYGKRLMTPQEAAQIGSFVTIPNDSSSNNNNNEPPPQLQLETIYVSVASYRDYECTPTVQDIYERAQYPQRIRVAVIDQMAAGTDQPCLTTTTPCDQDPTQTLCQYRHLIDYYHLDAQLAVGPVFARHLAHRLYRGEYFAMQVDSHVRFTQHWDSWLTQHWKNAKNEYAVLSTYLSDINGRIHPQTHNVTELSRPIMCNSDFEGAGDNKHLRHGQQPEGVSQIRDQPTLQPFWAAGFSFARGHFVVNIPYDQYLPMIFQGEEISIGLRAFTYGYDFYAPQIGVVYHIYAAKDASGKRNHIPMFWENSGIYSGSGLSAMKRLNTIIGLNKKNYPLTEWPHEEIEKYGRGTVRTTEKFYKTFGIHVEQQKIEQHLCRFVGKPMMKEFLPALRENRMGLDYDKITYEFKDPVPASGHQRVMGKPR